MKRRPVNLNFLTIRFPITAWVSIAHRLSGVVVFLMIPALLWMLQESLASHDRFTALSHTLTSSGSKLILWGLLAALIYHLVAGIRHLLMDIHIGESKQGGRMGAFIVIGVSILFISLLGYWL